MKKSNLSYLLTLAGLILLAVGLYFIKTVQDPQGVMRALAYVCVGLGCVIFGHGMGEIISRDAIKNSPTTAKQIEIDKNDERNVAIANRAKAKAWDMVVFVFGALMLVFIFMDTDMTSVLLLVSAYLFVIGYAVYYRCKYDKEM
jgi:4-hydroxybenzoate polyprenyltransferase